MKKTAQIIAIVFALFISIFAFDEIGVSFVGFLIHLIPTFLIIAAILITRKYQAVGAGLFVVLFIATVVFFKTYEDIIVFMLISLPIAIVAFLTIMDLAHKRKQKSR